MKKTTVAKGLALFLALAAGCWLGYAQIMPPSVPKGFVEQHVTLEQAQPGPDLGLMLSHIKAMSAEVHSVDSPGQIKAQAYLMEQLAQMGLSYEVESYELTIPEVLELETERSEYRGKIMKDTEESIREYAGIGDKPTMNLHNVIVKLDAPDTDETILFVAHTDSVKFGPGAFDDIVSCAGMLEALRMLKDTTPVRDLVFLFSDGEEQGLLGAAKYVADHPEMKEITRLAVNLEARGNTGAVLMFETTPNNYAMVNTYRAATQRPVSVSIATAVYRMMQNDTDLTRFMMQDYPGLNFAVIEGAEVYHTPEDNYEGFNRNSAMHYLQTITSMAQYFATEPTLNLTSDEDAVFFPLLPGNLVVMSQTVSNVLCYGAVALLLVLLIWLGYHKRVRVGTLVGSMLTQILVLAVAGGLSYGLVQWVTAANNLSSYQDFLRYPHAQTVFFAMLLGLTALGALVFWAIFRKNDSPLSVALGTLPLFALLAVGTTLFFPSANFLFSLPLLAALVCALLASLWCDGAILPVCLLAVGALLLFTPIVYLVFVALNLSMSFAAVALFQLPATLIWGAMALTKKK